MVKLLAKILQELNQNSQMIVGKQKIPCKMIATEQASKIVTANLMENAKETSKVKSMQLNIDRMLTVSTSHVTEETYMLLTLDGIANKIELPVYIKGTADNGENYGLYIYLIPNCLNWDKIPKDLAPLIKLAIDNECSILCLDSDGNELEEFPTYDY